MIEDIMEGKFRKNNNKENDNAEEDAKMGHVILQVPALEMERLLVQNARLLTLNRSLMNFIVGHWNWLRGELKEEKAVREFDS